MTYCTALNGCQHNKHLLFLQKAPARKVQVFLNMVGGMSRERYKRKKKTNNKGKYKRQSTSRKEVNTERIAEQSTVNCDVKIQVTEGQSQFELSENGRRKI